MRNLLGRAFLLAVATIGIVLVIPLAVLGQQKKVVSAKSSVAGSATTAFGGWRTFKFETNKVTAPDVAVSPDGEWLIFSMLGKLFRLPVKGGEAEQLTFGPYYDNDPVISPDGKLVAFESDRDGSAGNIFLLTLATLEIRQLTREDWADRPAWAADGRSLLYLRLERKSWGSGYWMPRPPALVRRVSLAGGEPETLREQGEIWSVFYLPDGRVGWTLVNHDATPAEVELPQRSPPAAYSTSRRVTTRIEVRDTTGKVSTVRTFDGIADPVVPSPKADGLYVRSDAGARNDIQFAPTSEGSERRIFPVSGERAGFAISPDNGTLYLGNLGHLWKVALPGGRREAVPFRAKVTLEMREPTAPPRWTPIAPGDTPPLRIIQQPRLSPDGSEIVFRALAHLWRQPLKGGPARRLVESDGTESDAAFSPDGREIAFVRRAQDKREIQVLNLATGKTRTIAAPTTCGYKQLSWSLHGELIAATACDHDLVAIDPVTLKKRLLYAKSSNWEPYPLLSADGTTLYFQARLPGAAATIYRMRLQPEEKPQPLLPGVGHEMHISSRGQWVVQVPRSQPGVRLARLEGWRIVQTDARTISEAGQEFSFTPDGSALLYVAGGKLWREPLAGGARQEIPIRLTLRAATPPPVLLERVRVLDFDTGGFTTETSLLIENGRIQWIGPVQGRGLPPQTRTVDAGGRFAVPGFFDMHGHGNGCGGAENIAHGVTSVRNMGGYSIAGQNADADRSDFTNDAVPRCFYAGRILEGPQGGLAEEHVHPTSEDAARMFVRRWKAEGAHFIKLYNRVPWPLQRAAADEARRSGLPVVAHGLTLEQVVKGVILGYAGFTHWSSGWPRWWSSTSYFYDDALQMFAAAGTRWEPTLGLALAAGDEKSFREDPERFRRVEGGNINVRIAWASLPDEALGGMWAERLRTMRLAYRRGVTFLPGTDRGPEGLALHWELEHYAEAGIPPLAILKFASHASAQTVGAEGDLGTLKTGKMADILLLDKNPLEEIRNTQTIWRVIKGGWLFDPKVLLPSPN